MKISDSVKGYAAAVTAAAAYGTIPAFAVPLYSQDMNPNSVLLIRYVLDLPVLALMVRMRGRSLRVERAALLPLLLLGVFMALSSITLFMSYTYMNAGVASTVLFVYPVMVAIILSVFFRERFRLSTGLCLVIIAVGMGLMTHPSPTAEVSATGCVLSLLSALTYALYLVIVNVSASLRRVPTTVQLFYVLLSGSLVFVAVWLAGTPFSLPSHPSGWLNIAALALIPTILSLSCTTAAIQRIGSTSTAIFGALEPVTAVVLSVLILHQGLDSGELVGGLLILAATTMTVLSDRLDRVLLRTRRMFPRLRK